MEVTMVIEKRIKIQLILLFLVSEILCGIDFEKLITLNPRGWNLPDISKLEKATAKEIILVEMPPIISIAYKKRKDLKDAFLRTINRRIANENKGDDNSIYSYKVEYFNSLKVYIFKENNKILCYHFSRIVSDKTAKDFINEYNYGLQNGFFFDEGIEGNFESTFIFDADNDGIFESSVFAPPDGKMQGMLKEIFNYKQKSSKIGGKNVSKKMFSFWQKWIRYLYFPSQKNANNVLKSLCELGDSGSHLLDETELECWALIWDSLDTLEKDVYASEPIAVKIAFRLLPKSINSFSGKVIEVLKNFIRINPEMFLKELNENFGEIKLSIFGGDGIVRLGYSDLATIEIKNRINSLSSVNNPKLLEIRKKIIRVLENDLKYLEKDVTHQQ